MQLAHCPAIAVHAWLWELFRAVSCEVIAVFGSYGTCSCLCTALDPGNSTTQTIENYLWRKAGTVYLSDNWRNWEWLPIAHSMFGGSRYSGDRIRLLLTAAGPCRGLGKPAFSLQVP